MIVSLKENKRSSKKNLNNAIDAEKTSINGHKWAINNRNDFERAYIASKRMLPVGKRMLSNKIISDLKQNIFTKDYVYFNRPVKKQFNDAYNYSQTLYLNEVNKVALENLRFEKVNANTILCNAFFLTETVKVERWSNKSSYESFVFMKKALPKFIRKLSNRYDTDKESIKDTYFLECGFAGHCHVHTLLVLPEALPCFIHKDKNGQESVRMQDEENKAIKKLWAKLNGGFIDIKAVNSKEAAAYVTKECSKGFYSVETRFERIESFIAEYEKAKKQGSLNKDWKKIASILKKNDINNLWLVYDVYLFKKNKKNKKKTNGYDGRDCYIMEGQEGQEGQDGYKFIDSVKCRSFTISESISRKVKAKQKLIKTAKDTAIKYLQKAGLNLTDEECLKLADENYKNQIIQGLKDTLKRESSVISSSKKQMVKITNNEMAKVKPVFDLEYMKSIFDECIENALEKAIKENLPVIKEPKEAVIARNKEPLPSSFFKRISGKKEMETLIRDFKNPVVYRNIEKNIVIDRFTARKSGLIFHSGLGNDKRIIDLLLKIIESKKSNKQKLLIKESDIQEPAKRRAKRQRKQNDSENQYSLFDFLPEKVEKAPEIERRTQECLFFDFEPVKNTKQNQSIRKLALKALDEKKPRKPRKLEGQTVNYLF